MLIVAADKSPKTVNMDEATKILYDGEKIVKIGKDLKEFTHVDSGLFFGRKELGEIDFEGNLSELMLRLGKRGGVGEFEGLPWFDVDTLEELLESVRGYRVGYTLQLLRENLIKLHVDRPAAAI